MIVSELLILYIITLIMYTFRKDDVQRWKKMDKLSVLMQTRDDARGELKQRIMQRDNFAVQYTVLVVAMLTIAFSGHSDRTTVVSLMLLPVLTDFYTILMDSSYRVHNRLVEYLNSEVEPRLETDDFRLWEHYCKDVRLIEGDSAFGGRQYFFHVVLVCMPVVMLVLQLELVGRSWLYFIYFAVMLAFSVLYLYNNSRRTEYKGDNKLAFCDYERKERLTDEPGKALFLDRDGTLHVDKVMTHRLRDLELLPGAEELVRKAHDLGYKVVIITNQSAIGKGYYSKFRMHLFNCKLRWKLKCVDAIYYCPHTKDVQCNCRKPKTGMIQRAKKKYNLDLSQCVVVGDRMSDIITASNA